MFQRLFSNYFRVAAPSIVISLSILLLLSFINAQEFKQSAMSEIYHQFRAALHEQVTYDENGDPNLDTLLGDAGLTYKCGIPDFEDLPGPSNSDAVCDSDTGSITYPIFDYMWSTNYGVHSLSVWEAGGEPVTVFPETQRENLVGQWQYLSSAAEERIVLSDIPFPGHYVYRLNPGDDFPNWDNLPIVYAVPIKNSSKTETAGAVYLIMDPPNGEMGPIFIVMVIFFLPLVLVVGWIFSFFFSRSIRKRVAQVQTVIERWAEGDFAPRLSTKPADEIGRIGSRLNEMAEQLADLFSAKLALASVETRHQLARDLHDAAKQQLFAATMQLRAANSLLDVEPVRARKHLTSATDLTKQAQQELVAVIHELRPIQLQESGFEAAVEQLITNFSDKNEISIQLHMALSGPTPSDVEQALFRILQEGLSNIEKHSQATDGTILFQTIKDKTELIISDNGMGFDLDQASDGFGLQSIAQRVEQLNGQLTIKSEPKNGTIISILI